MCLLLLMVCCYQLQKKKNQKKNYEQKILFTVNDLNIDHKYLVVLYLVVCNTKTLLKQMFGCTLVFGQGNNTSVSNVNNSVSIGL